MLVVSQGRFASADPGSGAHAEDTQHGLAVVGVGHDVELAWPLAKALYADPALRPPSLDEAHARVLVGEDADPGAPAELRDLAESRAAIHGEDAASRRLLASIAAGLHVKGLVLVEGGASANIRPVARVFVASLDSFDAVRYEPDPSAPVTWGNGSAKLTWSGSVTALHRGFADVAPPPPPPTIAVVSAKTPAPAEKDTGKQGATPFYKSPWFWAAAGAALFAAGAVYLATRNEGPDNIQLQVSVPK
jgi:hypothetical protein